MAYQDGKNNLVIISLLELDKVHSVTFDQEILQIQILDHNLYFLSHKESKFTLNQVSIEKMKASEKPKKMKSLKINELFSYTKDEVE